MSDQTIALLLGTFGTIIAGFFKLINDQNKTSAKQVEVHSKIADGLAKLETSGNKQAEAMNKVASETKLGNKQSAERNGHLGEQNIQITKLITETRADMLSAVENVKEQHVTKQVVEHQDVKE